MDIRFKITRFVPNSCRPLFNPQQSLFMVSGTLRRRHSRRRRSSLHTKDKTDGK